MTVGVCHSDLFAIPLVIHFHQRIVAFVRGAAHRIRDEDNPITDVYGSQHTCKHADVNTYLKEITGKDITAKDFRTWAGTVLAAMALNEVKAFDSAAQAKRNLRTAIEQVAARLGNTPTICRKCYVHPRRVDIIPRWKPRS
jgi:DNA topoisomerase-1